MVPNSSTTMARWRRRLLEFLEEVEDGLHGFWDDEDFAHDLLQAEFGEGRAGEAGLRGARRKCMRREMSLE